jgi:hypothetical protein
VSITCPCGAVHEDASALEKVGWQALGGGEFVLLVNCHCHSTICAGTITDAAQCDVCRRVIPGSGGDHKVCVFEGDPDGMNGRNIVLCAGCYRRDPRKTSWEEWRGGRPRMITSLPYQAERSAAQ